MGIRELLIGVLFIGSAAPAARAACTSQGHPNQVTLTTTVVEHLDDASYKAGRDVWVPVAVKADAQVLAWLVWSEWPTGQGCAVRFNGIRNDSCGSRVDIQFEQRTDYNVGILASDLGISNSQYPYNCSLVMTFHVEDTKGNPVRPGSSRTVPDPGFDMAARLSLQVTNMHYETSGGVPSVPPGVKRNGKCPEAKAGDAFPSFMLTGPGCPGPTRVNSNPASSSSVASTATWQGITGLAGTATPTSSMPSAAPPQGVGAMRAAARARLRDVLGQVAADTTQRNGRPVLVSR